MKKIFAVAALALAGTQAQAAVIDFNHLTGSGIPSRGYQYQEDGFQLDNLSTAHPFRSIQSDDYRYTGSVSFFNDTIAGVTKLSKIGGGTFDLDSIDLDSLNEGSNVTVSFVGTLLDSSTVVQSFTTDSLFPGLQTFTFSSLFDTVVSVSWTQDWSFHSFDNIVVDGADNQVPEPATLGLAALGMLGLGLSRRRQA